jgi:hypothetical protein
VWPFVPWREIVIDFAEALAPTIPVYRGWHRVQGQELIAYNLAGVDRRQLFPTTAAALVALLRYPLRTLSVAEVEAIGRADGLRGEVAPRE